MQHTEHGTQHLSFITAIADICTAAVLKEVE
jgi:hypothetical protein